MVVAARVTEQAYLTIALADPSRALELHDGRLVEKPAMSFTHNYAAAELRHLLREQLEPARFVVGIGGGRLRTRSGRYLIPDVFVVATTTTLALRGRSDLLEVYPEPVLLVVEIWSPSTGDYDVEVKLTEYQQRGDREIWRLHPYEQTLTAWVWQASGPYRESTHGPGDVVQPVWLPDVAIDLDALFAVIG